MIALVLSGAANFGVMQAGALEVLFRAGLKPNIVVGTSAGALNAIYIASNPTPEGARQLGNVWGELRPVHVGRGGIFTGLRRLLARRDSLFMSEPLVAFLQEHIPGSVETFGQLAAMCGVRAYAMAMCIKDEHLVAFGDREDDRLIDGAMASTAIPPFFPPWQVNGHRYVDGGVAAKLPVLAAIERGATQVIAVDIEDTMKMSAAPDDLFHISGCALSIMADHQARLELALARYSGVPVRVFTIHAPDDVGFWDFSQASYLYQMGKEITQKVLKEEPLRILPKWQTRIRKRFVSGFHRLMQAEQRFAGGVALSGN
jgi:NTE family protein